MVDKYEITIFKTQLDVVNALKDLIDRYWAFQVNEEEFINRIKKIVKLNKDKVFTPTGEITSIVNQRLGKKRMSLILTIISKGK